MGIRRDATTLRRYDAMMGTSGATIDEAT